jgi:osmotically-inducible protein OsmY
MNPTPAADPAGNPISGADPTGMPPGDARDAAITDQVKRIVESDTAISAEARRAVNVRTKDGVVTLEGTVPAQTDKEIIEAKASRLPAVAKVENKITVKAP